MLYNSVVQDLGYTSSAPGLRAFRVLPFMALVDFVGSGNLTLRMYRDSGSGTLTLQGVRSKLILFRMG